jgi:hypothetical protein
VLDCGKRRAQHLRGRSIATQLIHSPLARGRGRSELHGEGPESRPLRAAALVEHVPFIGAVTPDLRWHCARLATVAPAEPPRASIVC